MEDISRYPKTSGLKSSSISESEVDIISCTLSNTGMSLNTFSKFIRLLSSLNIISLNLKVEN